MSTSRLLTGDALLKQARELGVSTEGERPELGPDGVVIYTPAPASEREIQRRVMEAERHLRERRLFMLTMASVALGAGVGIGGLWATVHNGNLQTENAKRLLSVQLQREFDQRFESESMRRSRAELAAALLRGAAPPTDDV